MGYSAISRIFWYIWRVHIYVSEIQSGCEEVSATLTQHPAGDAGEWRYHIYSQEEGLPATLRYFNGGTNSVRGWGRQQLGPALPSFDDEGEFDGYVPVGGRTLFNFNVELRQQLTGITADSGIAACLDGGQVWRSVGTLKERQVQFGAGGGIRYQSPIGPVRIDIAYKLNPMDQDLNIYQGQGSGSTRDRIGIHFSIGQAF